MSRDRKLALLGGSKSQQFGKRLAELGAFIDCVQSREASLVKELQKRFGQNSGEFVVSKQLDWTEQPSNLKTSQCAKSSTGPGANLQNIGTFLVKVLKRPVTESDDSSCSCDEDSSPLPKPKSNRRKSKSLKATSSKKQHKSLRLPSKKNSTPSPLPQPNSAKPKLQQVAPKVKESVSAADVSDLYRKLKLGSKKRQPSVQCSSDSSDSSDDSCRCVTGCVPCPPRIFPELKPYAITIQAQFTRLRGRLQLCDGVLVHKISSSLINKIENELKLQGVNYRGGILRRLPRIPSAGFSGLINNSFGGTSTNTLNAIIDFKNRLITLGQTNLNLVATTPAPLFGPVTRAQFRSPQFVQYGLGTPGQFLSGFFTFSLILPLDILEQFASQTENSTGVASSTAASSNSDEADVSIEEENDGDCGCNNNNDSL